MNALVFLRRTSVMALRRWHAPPPAMVLRALSTKVQTFAVEAPDGTSEALMDAERHEVEDIVQHAARFEDAAFVENLHQQQQDAAKIFAVDDVEGESDDMHKEDMQAVEEIIDYAAEHEDKEKIRRGHELEKEVRKMMSKRAGFPDL